MNIIEWVKKNAVLKEGASIDELKKLEKDLNPLENIKDINQATDFMNRSPVFKSALDSVISKAVASHDEKFQKEKLPEILKAEKEKLAKELNPEETPEQKQLREMREKMEALENERKRDQIKAELLLKSKEIGFSGNVEKYLVYGDKAIEVMENDFKEVQGIIAKKEEEIRKEYFKGNPPKGGTPNPNLKTMGRAEFDQLSHTERMEFVKNGGVTVD